MSRKLTIVLAVSLILNVFLLGTGVGVLLVRDRLAQIASPPAARPGDAAPLRGIRALQPEKRGAFREAVRSRMDQIGPKLDAARDARRAAQAAFTGPTFDPATARAALANARTAEHQARAEMDNAMVEFAAGLSAEDRQALGWGMGRYDGRRDGDRDGRGRGRD